jgi:hypothetical protein
MIDRIRQFSQLGAPPLVWKGGSWVSFLRNSKLKTENLLLLPEAES